MKNINQHYILPLGLQLSMTILEPEKLNFVGLPNTNHPLIFREREELIEYRINNNKLDFSIKTEHKGNAKDILEEMIKELQVIKSLL